MTGRIRTLMLVGASTTPAMADLSELYARGAVDALADVADITVLHCAPGKRRSRRWSRRWSLPRSLSHDDLRNAERLSLPDAMAELQGREFEAGLPQMFCPFGMTAGRNLFELLCIPMIGNSPTVMGIGADKALARAVIASAGVRVPDGVVVRSLDALPELPALPVVVKPVLSDNSEGLSLVGEPAELRPAIARALSCGSAALVERFIPPGRELRGGVLEIGGELRLLRPEEYPVGGNRPVRVAADKLARDGTGALRLAAKTSDGAWLVDPDDPVIPAIHAAVARAFRALGCRHYGLFDFRVDDEGAVWFLEAGLYCSFAESSVICAMAKAEGMSPADLFLALVGEL